MIRNAMMQKDQVGRGRRHKDHPVSKKRKAVKQAQKANKKKVMVWVPELKMYLQVVPGTDMAPIIKQHMEMKEWRSKTLVH